MVGIKIKIKIDVDIDIDIDTGIIKNTTVMMAVILTGSIGFNKGNLCAFSNHALPDRFTQLD